MSGDYKLYVLRYLPGSFDEGFYAGKSIGMVDSASQYASQMSVARGQGQPDQTPYYIVYSKNQRKYVVLANNMPDGTSDKNFDRVATDLEQARALSEIARRHPPGQGGGRRRHRKSHRKSHRRHL